jgi:hypothetical protein
LKISILSYHKKFQNVSRINLIKPRAFGFGEKIKENEICNSNHPQR